MEVLYLEFIAVGLLVSTLFWEAYGISVGGLIVPGYLALYFNQVDRLVMTVLAALLTYFSITLLKNVALIYGKRRNTLVLLLGFVWGEMIRQIGIFLAFSALDLDPIGYIIPGLIALSMDKQGISLTISAMLIASAIVRLLILLSVEGILLS